MSTDKKRIKFPKYLERPRLKWVFEVDDIAVAVVSFNFIILVFFFTEVPGVVEMIVGLIFGYVSLKTYQQYKKDYHVGHAIHFLYEYDLWHPDRGSPNENEKMSFIPRGYEKRFCE